MNRWIRAERRILFVLGCAWASVAAACYLLGRPHAPAPGLGDPVQVSQYRGSTRIVYVVDQMTASKRELLGNQLRNRGYKNQPDAWPGLFMKNKRDFVHVYDGDLLLQPNGQRQLIFAAGRTTVVRTVRQPTWSTYWRRFKRDWNAPRRTGKSTNLQKEQESRFRSSNPNL